MTIDRSAYQLDVEDTFASSELDPGLWIPFYLPHWSSRQASAARYTVGGGSLRLRIEADQGPWAPEWDGYLRVSSVQTGLFAGPVGSGVGQHRFRDDLVVREAQARAAHYTPRYGLFEMRARALDDPSNMVALWMIGLGDPPEQSAEICIFEIFGRDVRADTSRVGMGVHPFEDPTITDEFAAEPVAIDAREAHWYAAEWTPDHVAFYVDEREIKVVPQSPSYPMAFMLDIYEFAEGPEPASPPDRYPKEFVVEAFRGWRPIGTPLSAGAAPRLVGTDRARLRRLRTEELTTPEVTAIRDLLRAAFGPEEDEQFGEDDWQHALGGLHFVLDLDGVIVGHASVVERELHVDDRPLRTGYVEAVGIAPDRHGVGLGAQVMTDVNAWIRERYELGALGTGRHGFYERLGWQTWAGPTSVRTADGTHRTPDEDGYILVLETPSSPPLDLTAAISCEWRAGDVW